MDDETRTLVGYVGSQALRGAIGDSIHSSYSMIVVLIGCLSDRAKQLVDNLQPDTLCSFNPDPAEQPDARWSAICSDEDTESNVRYAVATPGILRLWPWVNQVRRLHPRLRSDNIFLSLHVDQTPLTVSSKMPLEVVMQVFKRMGYVVATHTHTPLSTFSPVS